MESSQTRICIRFGQDCRYLSLGWSSKWKVASIEAYIYVHVCIHTYIYIYTCDLEVVVYRGYTTGRWTEISFSRKLKLSCAHLHSQRELSTLIIDFILYRYFDHCLFDPRLKITIFSQSTFFSQRK